MDNLPKSVEKLRVLWKTFSLLPNYAQFDSVNMGGSQQIRPYMEITLNSDKHDEIPSQKEVSNKYKDNPQKVKRAMAGKATEMGDANGNNPDIGLA